MMNPFKSKILALTLVLVGTLGCNKQLDLVPTNDITPGTLFSTATGYDQFMAKVYGSFALTGNNGPAGSNDLPFGGDEGWSDFYRGFWKMQELTTDEAVVAWSDPGLPDLHTMNWSSNNPFIQRIYARPLFQIVLCNTFLKESTDGKLSERGIGGADAERIRKYRQEARFLRAFQYWVLLDLFRNPTFVTEADEIGPTPPKQTNAKDLYAYIEAELRDLEVTLDEAKVGNDKLPGYGRANRRCAQALLARLSLNATTYIGEDRSAVAAEYALKVISSGLYTLTPDYRHLMRADNDKPIVSDEFIFTINYDGIKTQTYGGTTFLVNASIGGDMKSVEFGVTGNWGGIRTTKNLPLLFDTADKRQMFYTSPTIEVNTISTFADGWPVTKFRNIRIDGTAASNEKNSNFVDIDMPLFRLAEMYLIYAEANLRSGAGDRGTALEFLNRLRSRAFPNGNGQITDDKFTLDYILDERARELYWEGHRRTDLIRFDKFVEGTYLWPWKGGSRNGSAVNPKYKIFPIPSNDITNNPKLVQNPNY